MDKAWIEWPEEPGFYWFYGYTHRVVFAQRFNDEPKLITVRIHRTVNSFAVVGDGEFIYKEQAKGLFLPLAAPELPELDSPQRQSTRR